MIEKMRQIMQTYIQGDPNLKAALQAKQGHSWNSQTPQLWAYIIFKNQLTQVNLAADALYFNPFFLDEPLIKISNDQNEMT